MGRGGEVGGGEGGSRRMYRGDGGGGVTYRQADVSREQCEAD